MSWDSYIDNLVSQSNDGTGTPHCDSACIIGLDGSLWTSGGHSKSLQITQAEARTVSQAMKGSDFTPFQAGGIHIAGVKYQFLRGEDTICLGKKKDAGSITLQKSKTAVVIGHTKEGGQQGFTNKAVGVIAEYLESMNM